jgi:type IV pilus assembly protein PilV
MQRGYSLLELLVTLLVFSVGMLAVAGLQTVSKQANYEGMQRTTAAHVAYGLLEDMRVNGDAIDIYRAAGEIGEGSRGDEPAPNCSTGSPCNSAQQANHDLWVWEQMLDGNLETSGGAGAGGLLLPRLCISGPALGGAGLYQVTIVWHGSAAMTNAIDDACGLLTGNYGANNEFRRIMRIPTYIDPTM